MLPLIFYLKKIKKNDIIYIENEAMLHRKKGTDTMNGVTILTSYDLITRHSFNIGWGLIGLIIGAALVFLFAVLTTPWSDLDKRAMIALMIFFGVVGGTLLGIAGKGPNTEYTTYYQVACDDTVSVNALLTQYDIIEQDGYLLTVVEKEAK